MTSPTPWGTGLAFAAFVAVTTGLLVGIIGWGLLAIHPLVALALNGLVAAGAAPALWERRHEPVQRWAALGLGAGTVVAWIALVGIALGG
ncbi:DUF2537 domain-containing protein [Hoyosella sp. G463]|uniref:DUF2537 domain-containing protein n=1 Tax=Lolliginicoccus lacisalsi TaxID=2742202 RepID=A0A927JB14_9ACTN|nr:DUF2537 domain-containing protein [Lolliginicoccus lacisalsi]MBD8505813.1 DUF2537 domain-containing protein [Lolliginicoccus lacisalsi]